MFQTTQQFNDIFDALNGKDLLFKEAEFVAYNDGMLTYYFEHEDITHEITIMCDDSLLKTEPIMELLNMSRIKYFDYVLYHNNKNIGRITWSMAKELSAN